MTPQPIRPLKTDGRHCPDRAQILAPISRFGKTLAQRKAKIVGIGQEQQGRPDA